MWLFCKKVYKQLNLGVSWLPWVSQNKLPLGCFLLPLSLPYLCKVAFHSDSKPTIAVASYKAELYYKAHQT